MSEALRLELRQISKTYQDLVANDQINLAVRPGSIHAILGENGAGKSTLMKIIYGVVQPDAGQIFLDGQALEVQDPSQARAAGIAMVFQHFSLFETLTVAENVSLGLSRSLSLASVEQLMVQKASEYGLPVDPRAPVHSLSVGERQRVEIIRALLTQPKLLILDEPTSVLTPDAIEKLFDTLRLLKSQGCSVLYISHKLHEIRALCDHCTILRAGQWIGDCIPAQETDESLSKMMIGDQPVELMARSALAGQQVLEVNGLNLKAGDAYGVDLQSINLQVRQGEILGIAGVSGNGQKQLFACLSGEDMRADQTSIQFKQQAIGQADPQTRRRLGLHAVPDERLGRGAVPMMSLAHNMLLTRRESIGTLGWLRLGQLRQHTSRIIQRFGVKASGAGALASSLSGGNLQKFIMGREIDAAPQLLLIAQPTWGIDVGATARIRNEIMALRQAGCAIIVISEDIDELFELADRMQVMFKGEISPSIERSQASLEMIGRWMSGLWPRTDRSNSNPITQEHTHAAV